VNNVTNATSLFINPVFVIKPARRFNCKEKNGFTLMSFSKIPFQMYLHRVLDIFSFVVVDLIDLSGCQNFQRFFISFH